MKKIIFITLLFAACKSNSNGTYVNHTEGQFSIADDTVIIADTIVFDQTGFQKKRNGKLLPKALKTRKWSLNGPDAPAMRINGDQVIIGSTIYTKLP